MTPERIAGRYRVERAAGRGGMGTVWLCTDEVLGRQVAVKQVGTLPGENTLDLARALREARSSAALNHRNVVAVYDAVEEGDHIWLVMEYVQGRTLAELMEQQGRIPPDEAARIGAQVADGLAAAHARGTIHRDVKPGNILLAEDGTAKISDFGISRTAGDDQLTSSGIVMGTPTYFAPELARGEEPTPAADVWALGATLFAAVEGRPLYPDQPNALAMLGEIARSDPPRPQRAGILTEPIVRSLDRDPRSRWSMEDLAHVLHRLDDKHAQGRTQTVTAATATAAAGASDQPARSEDTGPDPEPVVLRDAGPSSVGTRRPSRGGRLIAVGLVALLVIAGVGGALLLRDLDTDPAPSAAGTPTDQASPEEGSPSEDESPTEDATEEPTESPTETATQTPTATPTGSADGTGAERFVATYYATLPDDTEAGWASLAPALQREIGYGSYRGFWNTVDDVTVTDTRSAGRGTVEVSLTYTQDDRAEDETRRITVDRTDGSYLIQEDEVIG